MSGSHDKLPKLFWVQIILVAVVGTLYLFAPKAAKHTVEASTEVKPVVKKAQQALAPIGKVEAKVEAPAPGPCVARTGESIYKETCATCHATGIANAPKLDDKAAWESRMANGIDGLVKTAIAGKGAMPARGGNPAITDEEMKEIILYMTKSAGIEVSAPAKVDAPPTATETIATEKTATTTAAMPAPVTAGATTIAKAPEAPAAPKSPTAPEPVAAVTETPTAPEVVKAQTEAPKAPEPEIVQKEVPKAPEPEVAEKEAPKTPEPAAITETQEAPAVDLAKGEKVYKTSCFACHESGVAGSPKLGDVTAWEARLAMGNEAMYASAINGKGVMPPKGGNMGLSDEDVKAAVDYIAAKSQ